MHRHLEDWQNVSNIDFYIKSGVWGSVHSLTHPTTPAGTHARRRFGLCWRRTGSFVLWCRSQAAGDPSFCFILRSHGGLGLGGRSEIATLNRPFSRGRGAAADT